MKYIKVIIFPFLLMVCLHGILLAQGVGIGTNTPDASAKLHISSTTQGTLITRMNSAQRDLISNPADGLMIYNTDSKCINIFKNSNWFEMCGNCIPPVSPVASSNSPVCSKDTLHLNASFISGASYSWTGPSGFSSALQNPDVPNISASGAGTYSVSVSIGSCTSNPAVTSVVVNPLPDSTFSYSPVNPDSLQTVTFSPTFSGANYSWTFQYGNPASSNLQNPAVVWNNTGTYSVGFTVTAVSGCVSHITSSIKISSCPPSGSQQFIFTGAMQTFTVPVCATLLTVQVWGAQGAGSSTGGCTGGLGGYSTGTLSVTPGATLNIYVGGQNGWNGGAAGGYNGGGGSGGNGGGASDIRAGGTNLTDRVIIAGGGGGAGATGSYSGPACCGNGGDGGGGGGFSGGGGSDNGTNGNSSNGGNGGSVGGSCTGGNGGGGGGNGGGGGASGNGGTPGTGGSNASGNPGSESSGGAGGTLGNGGIGGTSYSSNYGNAGGGGGGWWGGGGGGCWGHAGGGGGGSNYTTGLGGASDSMGVQSGDGKVVVSW